MTKSGAPIKLNFWQKLLIFLRMEYFTILAGLLVFGTWYFENITLDENRAKLADHLRLDNNVGQFETYHRVLQILTNLILYNQNYYTEDTATFHSDYFTNVRNELQIQNEIIYLMQMLSDPNDESVKSIKKEHTDQYVQDQKVLNDSNFVRIVNYRTQQLSLFSNKVNQMNTLKQNGLNRINEELKQKKNLYFASYFISAILFTIGRIQNVKKE